MSQPKKKILVFIDWYLPGFKAGGPVRSMANMVAHLSNRFDFFIVTRNTEYMESVPYPSVLSDAWNDVSPGVKVYYCTEGNATARTWRALMQQHPYHAVYINGIYSSKFSLLPLWVAQKMGVRKIIVAPRGMLAASAIGVKSVKKQLFIRAARLMQLYKGVQWHVTNPKERGEVALLAPHHPVIWVAPNLARPDLPHFQTVPKAEGHLRLASFARISPEKNSLFAIQCLQSVPADLHVSLHLYGQVYNPAYWEECQRAIDALPAHVRVEHNGVVDAEQVGPALANYHALLLPSRGENFGHVILESLSVGRPVVISDQTPWRSLQEKGIGWDLPLDQMELFAQAIAQLAHLSQPAFDRLCRQSYDHAQAFVNDQEMVGKYVEMLGEGEKAASCY